MCRDSRLKVVTFKLPVCLIEELNSLAQTYMVSRSTIIREAISEYLARKYMELNPKPKYVKLD